MVIDSNNPLPLYYQLREKIREKILSGEWKYGDEIPSETQLCKELGLSRATVKQAFDGLVSEGMIVRRRGKGTYVKYNKISYKLMEQPNFYAQIDGEGKEQQAVMLVQKQVQADEKVAEKLGIMPGEPVAYLKRIRCIDGVPIIIQDVYILMEYAKGILDQDLRYISWYRYVEEKNDFTLNHFHIDVEAITLSEEQKQCFGLKGISSGFYFDTVYQSNEHKVLYNKRIFRGDMVTLALDFDYTGEKDKKVFSIFNDSTE